MKIKSTFLFLILATSFFAISKDIELPFHKNSHHVFFTSDFLYWSIYYNVGNNSISKTNPGFRVGMGGILPHDDWQLYTEYTRITHGDHSLLKSHTFNTLDLSLGKYFSPSKTTLFFPFIGLKGALIVSNYHLQKDLLGKSSFKGLGFLGGFNTEWALPKYLRLFGNFSVACLTSSYHNTLKRSHFYTSTQSSSMNLKTMLDLILGIKSDFYFNEKKKHLALEAGWELQIWLNQNQGVLFNYCQSSGNLSFQGLTFKVRYDF